MRPFFRIDGIIDFNLINQCNLFLLAGVIIFNFYQFNSFFVGIIIIIAARKN